MSTKRSSIRVLDCRRIQLHHESVELMHDAMSYEGAIHGGIIAD